MPSLQQIEAAILNLAEDEFEQLREWLLEVDFKRWDRQIEQDAAEGKLDALANEAIAEFEAGHCREI